MITFRDHLNEKLKDAAFKKLYDDERQLIELAVKINQARLAQGFSREALAKMTRTSIKNIERIELGENVPIKTVMKVCRALGISFDVHDELVSNRQLEQEDIIKNSYSMNIDGNIFKSKKNYTIFETGKTFFKENKINNQLLVNA